MDFSLTEEQQLIRETAREFCDREIVPHAREWDRSERMDIAIVEKLADVGFLGCALPEEYGGMGLDTISYCLVMEELGRADSSVRGIVSETRWVIAHVPGITREWITRFKNLGGSLSLTGWQ